MKPDTFDSRVADLTRTDAEKLHELWERARVIREEMQDHLRSLRSGVCLLPANAHTYSAGGNCSCPWYAEHRKMLSDVEGEVRDLYYVLGLGGFPRS